MIRHYLLSCLISLLTRFVACNVARGAIIGGTRAGVNEFPYQVSVQIHEEHKCGGSIIGDQFILTVAHCVIKDDCQFIDENITVVAGTSSLNKIDESVLKISVKKIFVSTEFSPYLSINTTGDIAVLKLKQMLRLSASKHLKRLDFERNIHETYAGKTAVIAGFGWTWVLVDDRKNREGKNVDNYLHFAETDVLNNNQCQKNDVHRKITAKHLCAKVKQLDNLKSSGTCAGDSGGPLVHNEIIIGILSVGILNCSEESNPSVFTRVSHYINFIENAMKGIKTHDMRTHKQGEGKCRVQK